MSRTPVLALVAAFACRPGAPKPTPDDSAAPPLGPPADLVAAIDPFIATGGIGYQVGCAFPGAAVPFGLVKLSPDTADAAGASFGVYRGGGYHADDVFIQGFSHLHLHGVGLTDYGLIALMPRDGMDAAGTTEPGYRARFEKADESASAGAYTVRFASPDVTASLGATARTGLHRYAFGPETADPVVLLDLGHLMQEGRVIAADLTVDPAAGTIEGHLRQDGQMTKAPFSVWFSAAFAAPPTAWGVWTAADARVPGGTTASTGEGGRIGAWFHYPPGATVDVQVGVSVVDLAGARANRAAEATTLEGAQAAAAATWARWLAPFTVYGATPDDATIFATALYHSLLMPTRWDDVDGRSRAFGPDIFTPGHPFYTDMSLWDTYRTTHPLYTLAWPSTHTDILRSLARMAERGGNLPKWPLADWDGGFMVGSPAHIVVGEAWQKGLRTPDDTLLWENALALADGSLEPAYGGRPDVSWLDTVGYYPADHVGTSVAWTQEVALADHALAHGGRALGADASTLAWLDGRAQTWRALWDPSVGYFHGRNADGTFTPLENVSLWTEDFAEGNARQYRWMVPHDPEGMFAVMGGTEVALGWLDEFFREAELDSQDDVEGVPEVWYWHGNEIDLHAPWLFALAGDPASTQRWVDWIWGRWYGTGPNGLAGNDDGGTLSAWAVWAALGLYPLAGTDRYVLGAPRFPQVVVDRGAAGPLTIERRGSGPVTRVLLDGAPVGPDIRHDALMAASSLVFEAAE